MSRPKGTQFSQNGKGAEAKVEGCQHPVVDITLFQHGDDAPLFKHIIPPQPLIKFPLPIIVKGGALHVYLPFQLRRMIYFACTKTKTRLHAPTHRRVRDPYI